jgi:hypothetical protein
MAPRGTSLFCSLVTGTRFTRRPSESKPAIKYSFFPTCRLDYVARTALKPLHGRLPLASLLRPFSVGTRKHGQEMIQQKAFDTNTVSPDQEDASPRVAPNTAAYTNAELQRVAGERPRFKNVPENWKAIPADRFRRIIAEIEAVLLEISTDGKVTSNPFDWKPTIPTLHTWANHLRSALKELTK